ncbi:MAG: hypothetical protein AAF320_06430, partial [Myxococcota bacterium]
FKKIKNKSPPHFSTLKEYVNYFKLLHALHPKHFAQFKTEITEFHEVFLKQNCFLEDKIQQAAQELDNRISELNHPMQKLFAKSASFKNLEAASKPQINYLKQNEEFAKQMKEFFYLYKDEIERIFLIRDFFYGIRRYFCDKRKTEANLEERFRTWEKRKKFVKNLSLLINENSSNYI